MALERPLMGVGFTVLGTVAVLALTRCSFPVVFGTEEDCGPGRTNVGDNQCEYTDSPTPYDSGYTSPSTRDSGSDSAPRADAAQDAPDELDAPSGSSDGSDDGDSSADAEDDESVADALADTSADGM